MFEISARGVMEASDWEMHSAARLMEFSLQVEEIVQAIRIDSRTDPYLKRSLMRQVSRIQDHGMKTRKLGQVLQEVARVCEAAERRVAEYQPPVRRGRFVDIVHAIPFPEPPILVGPDGKLKVRIVIPDRLRREYSLIFRF